MSDFKPTDLKGMYNERPEKENYAGVYNPESFWDEYGKVYISTFNGKFDLNTQHLIARIDKTEPESVLEVGCGFGRNLPFVAENVPSIKRLVGVEFSKTMLERSEYYFNAFEKKYSQIELVNANAKELPFKDDEFDTVYSHVCLTHIPPMDISKVTSEISRVAKKWIIHIERFNFLYEHPNNHRWSHCLPPFYLDKGWDLWENDIIHIAHCTNAIVFKKI